MQWTLYKHFKGNPYIELGEGLDSETEEPFTLYRCLYDSALSQSWIRSHRHFHAEVSPGIPRFDAFALLRSSRAEAKAGGQIYTLLNMQRSLLSSACITPVGDSAWEVSDLSTVLEHQRKGHAGLLLRAILEVLSFFAGPRQIAPALLALTPAHAGFFERCGFRKIPSDLHRVDGAHLLTTPVPEGFEGTLKEWILTKKIRRLAQTR